jgi:hypothetical protein
VRAAQLVVALDIRQPASRPVARGWTPTFGREGGAMTWDALAAIAGTVAAFAVALTVVYLAIQVRRNTLATRSQTYYLATNALAEAAALIGTDPQVTRIYRIGLTNPDELTDNERMQFALLCVSQFRRYENLYFQYRTGLVDEDFWDGHRENILWFFYRPGMQAWWKERRLAFSKSFRDDVEGSRPSDLKSPSDRRV